MITLMLEGLIIVTLIMSVLMFFIILGASIQYVHSIFSRK